MGWGETADVTRILTGLVPFVTPQAGSGAGITLAAQTYLRPSVLVQPTIIEGVVESLDYDDQPPW
jgi:hypothetical protein